eukprot:6182406-Pleurochrysis_carterae.AAC.3
MAPAERGGGSGAAGVDGFGGGADFLANVIVGFVVGLACLDAGFDEGLACLAVAALLPNVSGESRAGTSSSASSARESRRPASPPVATADAAARSRELSSACHCATLASSAAFSAALRFSIRSRSSRSCVTQHGGSNER